MIREKELPPVHFLCTERERGSRLPPEEEQAGPRISPATTDQGRADWQRQDISAARFNFKIKGGQTIENITWSGHDCRVLLALCGICDWSNTGHRNEPVISASDPSSQRA